MHANQIKYLENASSIYPTKRYWNVKGRQGLPGAGADADAVSKRFPVAISIGAQCPHVDALAVASDVTREIRNFATWQTSRLLSCYLPRRPVQQAGVLVLNHTRIPLVKLPSFTCEHCIGPAGVDRIPRRHRRPVPSNVQSWQWKERERNSIVVQDSSRLHTTVT
jgi:hypothetical protein